MTLGVDKMVVTLGVDAYFDNLEADKLLLNELFENDELLLLWNGLSEDDKAKVIIKGTRRIDSNMIYRGIKIESNDISRLQWPRLLNNIKVECPTDVKLAILLNELTIIRNKNISSSESMKEYEALKLAGIKTYTVNKASITFSDSGSTSGNTSGYVDGLKNNEIDEEIYDVYLKQWTY